MRERAINRLNNIEKVLFKVERIIIRKRERWNESYGYADGGRRDKFQVKDRIISKVPA